MKNNIRIGDHTEIQIDCNKLSEIREKLAFHFNESDALNYRQWKDMIHSKIMNYESPNDLENNIEEISDLIIEIIVSIMSGRMILSEQVYDVIFDEIIMSGDMLSKNLLEKGVINQYMLFRRRSKRILESKITDLDNEITKIMNEPNPDMDKGFALYEIKENLKEKYVKSMLQSRDDHIYGLNQMCKSITTKDEDELNRLFDVEPGNFDIDYEKLNELQTVKSIVKLMEYWDTKISKLQADIKYMIRIESDGSSHMFPLLRVPTYEILERKLLLKTINLNWQFYFGLIREKYCDDLKYVTRITIAKIK